MIEGVKAWKFAGAHPPTEGNNQLAAQHIYPLDSLTFPCAKVCAGRPDKLTSSHKRPRYSSLVTTVIRVRFRFHV